MAYATLVQLHRYLEIPEDETQNDDLLEECLERAQAHIEGETRRVFESSTETRVYDAIKDVSDDGSTLWLDEDLLTLTTATNGDSENVTSDCVLQPSNRSPKFAIELKENVWTYDDYPQEAISIAGTWGYSATPPDDITQATIRLAAFLYKQRDAAAVDTASYYEGGILTIPSGIPQYVAMVIGRYKRRVLA